MRIHPEQTPPQNATDSIKSMSNAALAFCLRHPFEVRDIAAKELANRGCSPKGEWVGFPEAGQLARTIIGGKGKP